MLVDHLLNLSRSTGKHFYKQTQDQERILFRLLFAKILEELGGQASSHRERKVLAVVSAEQVAHVKFLLRLTHLNCPTVVVGELNVLATTKEIHRLSRTSCRPIIHFIFSTALDAITIRHVVSVSIQLGVITFVLDSVAVLSALTFLEPRLQNLVLRPASSVSRGVVTYYERASAVGNAVLTIDAEIVRALPRRGVSGIAVALRRAFTERSQHWKGLKSLPKSSLSPDLTLVLCCTDDILVDSLLGGPFAGNCRKIDCRTNSLAELNQHLLSVNGTAAQPKCVVFNYSDNLSQKNIKDIRETAKKNHLRLILWFTRPPVAMFDALLECVVFHRQTSNLDARRHLKTLTSVVDEDTCLRLWRCLRILFGSLAVQLNFLSLMQQHWQDLSVLARYF
eukprot:m.910358 g.910358  ORF g.910358 m.910358 type:complete len:394 (-) comp60109_c0_seq28:1732-2913(-)